MGNSVPEDEWLLRVAAEELACRTGMSVSDAFATPELQDAIMPVLVARAVGEAFGEILFDDCAGSVKVGVD